MHEPFEEKYLRNVAFGRKCQLVVVKVRSYRACNLARCEINMPEIRNAFVRLRGSRLDISLGYERLCTSKEGSEILVRRFTVFQQIHISKMSDGE